MKFNIHANSGIPWHERYWKLFRAGIERCGHELALFRHPDNINIVFGPNHFQKVVAEFPRSHVITVNRCFFGDANDNVAIGWGGFNGSAIFPFMAEPANRNRCKQPLRTVLESCRALLRPESPPTTLVLGEFQKPPSYFVGRCWLRPHPNGTPNLHGWPLQEPGRQYPVVGVYGGTTAVVDWVLAGSRVQVDPAARKLTPARWLNNPTSFDYDDRLNWLYMLQDAQWHVSEIKAGDWLPRLLSVRPV